MLLCGDLTRAAQAAIVVGVAVILSGSGEWRLRGGVFQEHFDVAEGGRQGGHGTLTGAIVPGGVRRRGSSNESSSETKAVSDSKPRSYRSWAAGGRVGCRYQALLKTAWWHVLMRPESRSR